MTFSCLWNSKVSLLALSNMYNHSVCYLVECLVMQRQQTFDEIIVARIDACTTFGGQPSDELCNQTDAIGL